MKEVQQTCHLLCLASRDPNSLYHVTIGAMYKKYLKPWYSKIKSLSFGPEASDWIYDKRRDLNPKWYQNVIEISKD